MCAQRKRFETSASQRIGEDHTMANNNTTAGIDELDLNDVLD